VAYDAWRRSLVAPGLVELLVDGVVVASARVEPPGQAQSSGQVSGHAATSQDARQGEGQGGGQGGGQSGGQGSDQPLLLASAAADRAMAVPGPHTARLVFTPDARALTAPASLSLPASSSSSSSWAAEAVALPFALDVRWASPRPPSAAGCAIGLRTALSSDSLVEGDAGELLVELTALAPVGGGGGAGGDTGGGAGGGAGGGTGGGGTGGGTEDTGGAGLPMTVAVVGLPGGLEVDDERLRLLALGGGVDLVERLGAGEVALYWRALPPGARRAVRLPFVAAVPGAYTGRASRAYLYYDSECKAWAEPLAVAVSPQVPGSQ
jgi:hypothetical protein